MKAKKQNNNLKRKNVKIKVSVVETKKINNKQYTTLLSRPILLNIKGKNKDDVSLGDELEVNVGL